MTFVLTIIFVLDMFEEEWLTSIWEKCLEDATMKVVNNPIHNSSFSHRGAQFISCAKQLLDTKTFSDKLGEKIVSIFVISCTGSSFAEMKECIYAKYHVSFVNEISYFLEELQLNVNFPCSMVH